MIPMTDASSPIARRSERWYVVKCQGSRESAASAHLRNQGYRVFLPCHQRNRRHARKIETALFPFFPGYLFVQLDISRERWRSINGTYGVSYLLMHGEAPAPVPVGIVEALRERFNENGVLTDSLELKAGQLVRIMNGALADFVGKLQKQDSAERVRVLLEIMGGEVSVVVPRAIVAPAHA